MIGEVRLRALTVADAEALFPVLSDIENSRFITFEPLQSLEETRVYLHWHIENGHYFAITLGGNPGAVGYVGVDRTADDPAVGKIGYVLDKRYWGNGYTSEAIRLLTGHLLKNTETRRIIATVKPENTSSQRCLEKAGYVFDKTLTNYVSSAAADKSNVRLIYHSGF